MKGNIEILGHVSPAVSGAQKAADIVAALAPPSGPASSAMVKSGSQSGSVVSAVKAAAPGLVGAGAGYFVWKKHPVLGALVGHAVASNGMDLVKGDRKAALCRLGVEGAGVAGALYYKKHPVIGYVAGAVAGVVATSFVDGSPSKGYIAYVKGKVGL